MKRRHSGVFLAGIQKNFPESKRISRIPASADATSGNPGTYLCDASSPRRQGTERGAGAYSPELRERAEDLFVIGGMTYAWVTWVTVCRIANWSNEGN